MDSNELFKNLLDELKKIKEDLKKEMEGLGMESGGEISTKFMALKPQISQELKDRLVDRYEDFPVCFVSTAEVAPKQTKNLKPYETCVYHVDFMAPSALDFIVEEYDSAAEALDGHEKWVASITENKLDEVKELPHRGGRTLVRSHKTIGSEYDEKALYFLYTRYAGDSAKYETQYSSPDYGICSGTVVIQEYDTEEAAIKGHKDWSDRFKNNPPDQVTESCTLEVAKKSFGKVYKRVVVAK